MVIPQYTGLIPDIRGNGGVGRGVGRHNEDTEDDSGGDGRSQEEPRLDRLDNAALAALAAPKPNSTSKYNFYVLLSKLDTLQPRHFLLMFISFFRPRDGCQRKNFQTAGNN